MKTYILIMSDTLDYAEDVCNDIEGKVFDTDDNILEEMMDMYDLPSYEGIEIYTLPDFTEGISEGNIFCDNRRIAYILTTESLTKSTFK